jgi:hypothetical protein
MTQAFNLALFANNLDSSGKLSASALQAGTYNINISGSAATASSVGGVSNPVSLTSMPGSNSGTFAYQKMPNGMIIQVGEYNLPIGDTAGVVITFPVPFPAVCCGVFSQLFINGPTSGTSVQAMHAWINGNGSATFFISDGGPSPGNGGFQWLAIGY